MKLIQACGLLVVLLGCIWPAGAHQAVDDTFTVFNCMIGDTISPLGNDIPFPDPSVTRFEITEAPKHIGIECFGDGECDPSLRDSHYFGPDSFSYRTYDGTSYSNVATVHLDIIPYAGTPPHSMFRLDYSTVENTGISATVDEGEYVYWVVTSGPGHGSLDLQSSWPARYVSFDYRPDPGFTGRDSFTVQLWYDTGSYGECPENWDGTITILVGNVPEFHSAMLPLAGLLGFLGLVLYIRRTRGN